MRLVALKITKEFTVMVAVPSAVSAYEVAAAASRSVPDINTVGSKHPWVFEAEASTLEGLHQRPDLGLSRASATLKIRSWSPGEYAWDTISTDEEFEQMTGRKAPPQGTQTDLFGKVP